MYTELGIEIMQLIENEDIVRFIKAQRLRWLGHIERMDEDKTPKRTYVHAVRRRGKWRDKVVRDVRKMSITNWRRRAKSREEWRHIVLQAKAPRAVMPMDDDDDDTHTHTRAHICIYQLMN